MIYTEQQFRERVRVMKWIPVTKRLPEGNGIQCLVSEIREGEPVTSDAFFYDGATGDDADDDGPFWIGEWDAHQLTPYAWMPWPEPMAPTGEPQ